jgi:hypothetical protein
MPELRNTKYYHDLQRMAKSSDRTTAYRAQCELEDIDDLDAGMDHWDGPRTDDPPESWFHPTGWRNDASPVSVRSSDIPRREADAASGEPVILLLHLAEKQNKAPLTVYKSESGAFKLFINWDYVLVSKPDQPGRTRHLHVPEHIELYVKEAWK